MRNRLRKKRGGGGEFPDLCSSFKGSKRRGKKNYVCLVSFFVFVFVDIPSMGNKKKSITLTKVCGPKNQT